MQIVIELSDETYKAIKEEKGIYAMNDGLCVRLTGKVVGAIQAGTPLPKGHGRIVDERKITKCGWNFIDHHAKTDALTIVQADTEREVSDADSD